MVTPDRIVGGSEAEPHSFPWQVAIATPGANVSTYHEEFYCAGSLVGPHHVVTAAQCPHK